MEDSRGKTKDRLCASSLSAGQETVHSHFVREARPLDVLVSMITQLQGIRFRGERWFRPEKGDKRMREQ